MWAWIEFNRHKTKLSGGLLYGGSCTITLIRSKAAVGAVWHVKHRFYMALFIFVMSYGLTFHLDLAINS
jgi:hypothetical protein